MADNKKSESKRYKLKITVHSAPKGCSLGFKEGDSWLITNRTPGGMCLSAYASMVSQIRTLRMGGGGNRDYCRVCCPDPRYCVVYEIKKIGTIPVETSLKKQKTASV